METLGSFEDLLAHLAATQIEHRANAETQTAYLPTKQGGKVGMMLVRWSPRFVHLMQVLDIDIPAERLPAVREAILRLNHQLVLPAFGFDDGTGRAYHRVAVPLDDNGLRVSLFRGLFVYALRDCDAWDDRIRDVALHGVDPATLKIT